MSRRKYTRAQFETSRVLGSVERYQTPHGNVYLNVMKRYARQKPYKDAIFNNIMMSQIKKMNDVFKSKETN